MCIDMWPHYYYYVKVAKKYWNFISALAVGAPAGRRPVHWHLRSCRPESSGPVVLSPDNKPVPDPPHRLLKTQKTQTHNFGRSHSRPSGDRTNCWAALVGEMQNYDNCICSEPASPGRRSPPGIQFSVPPVLRCACAPVLLFSGRSPVPVPVASVKVNSKLLLAKLLWRLVAVAVAGAFHSGQLNLLFAVLGNCSCCASA